MYTSEEQFYSAVTIAAIVLGIIIVVFIITMIRHQRRNVQLYKAKIRAEIFTLEKERRRIATDLHDELGPILSAVRIQINHLSADKEEDKKILTFANKHIDDLLAKTREISYNLMPNTLVRKGLVNAVKEYLGKMNEAHDLDITFQCSETISLPDEISLNIYRIVQEVTHNTIKHAEAQKLVVQLYTDDDKLVLMTADDGRGFDYENTIKKNKGLGLVNLQSRTEILNAAFNYRSQIDGGTQYVFEMPLKNDS